MKVFSNNQNFTLPYFNNNMYLKALYFYYINNFDIDHNILVYILHIYHKERESSSYEDQKVFFNCFVSISPWLATFCWM